MRRKCVGLLLLAAPVLAWAQAPKPAIYAQQEALARQLLDSPKAVDQAWGAYLVGRLGLAPLYTKLAERLAAPATGLNEQEADAVVQSLLDALIQSHLVVSPELLRPYEVRWPAETLILLARRTDNEDKLLELRETAQDEGSWYAINNLLLRKKSARMFLRTVAEAEFSLEIVVVDDGTIPGFGPGSGGGVGGRCYGAQGPPPGFPPIGYYTLSTYGVEGSSFFVDGPRAVFFHRSLGRGSPGVRMDRSPRLRVWSVRQYLVAFANRKRDDVWPLVTRSTSIHWRGVKDFDVKMDAAIQTHTLLLQDLFRACRANINGDIAGTPVEVKVKVTDSRGDRSTAIPAVPSFTVRISGPEIP